MEKKLEIYITQMLAQFRGEGFKTFGNLSDLDKKVQVVAWTKRIGEMLTENRYPILVCDLARDAAGTCFSEFPSVHEFVQLCHQIANQHKSQIAIGANEAGELVTQTVYDWQTKVQIESERKALLAEASATPLLALVENTGS